jgi:hypothetical protein
LREVSWVGPLAEFFDCSQVLLKRSIDRRELRLDLLRSRIQYATGFGGSYDDVEIADQFLDDFRPDYIDLEVEPGGTSWIADTLSLRFVTFPERLWDIPGDLGDLVAMRADQPFRQGRGSGNDLFVPKTMNGSRLWLPGFLHGCIRVISAVGHRRGDVCADSFGVVESAMDAARFGSGQAVCEALPHFALACLAIGELRWFEKLHNAMRSGPAPLTIWGQVSTNAVEIVRGSAAGSGSPATTSRIRDCWSYGLASWFVLAPQGVDQARDVLRALVDPAAKVLCEANLLRQAFEFSGTTPSDAVVGRSLAEAAEAADEAMWCGIANLLSPFLTNSTLTAAGNLLFGESTASHS